MFCLLWPLRMHPKFLESIYIFPRQCFSISFLSKSLAHWYSKTYPCPTWHCMRFHILRPSGVARSKRSVVSSSVVACKWLRWRHTAMCFVYLRCYMPLRSTCVFNGTQITTERRSPVPVIGKLCISIVFSSHYQIALCSRAARVHHWDWDVWECVCLRMEAICALKLRSGKLLY